MGTPIDRPRLASHVTKTRFLHIEDSLERRKLRFFIGAYQRGQGAGVTAFAFMDLDEARVVLSDLAWGRQTDYISYKGSQDGNGLITSRVLKIQLQRDEGKGGRGWIEVQNGPGELIGNNAVKPKGKTAVDVSIPLSVFEARKIAHGCLAYIAAWDVKEMLGRRERLEIRD